MGGEVQVIARATQDGDGEGLLPTTRGPSGRKLGRKAERFLIHLVWDGLSRRDAAVLAELSDRQSFRLLADADFLALYREAVKVRRRSEVARTVHRLAEIRDGKHPLAAVTAAKTLLHDAERLESEGQAAQAPGTPSAGYVIVVRERGPETPHLRATEAKPLIQLPAVHLDDGRTPSGADVQSDEGDD